MTTTTNNTTTSMQPSNSFEGLSAKIGRIDGRKIGINNVSGALKEIAVELFKQGAILVVADRSKEAVLELNKIIHHTGS